MAGLLLIVERTAEKRAQRAVAIVMDARTVKDRETLLSPKHDVLLRFDVGGSQIRTWTESWDFLEPGAEIEITYEPSNPFDAEVVESGFWPPPFWVVVGGLGLANVVTVIKPRRRKR